MNRESIDFAEKIEECPTLINAFGKIGNVKLKVSVGDMQPMTILEAMKFIYDNKVMGYKYNRGNGKVSSKTKNEVKNDFEPLSVRVITVGDFREDPWEGSNFIVNEAHGRVLGITEGVNEGKIKIDQLYAKCALQFVPPELFLRTYQKNNTTSSHTSNDRFSNPDLLYGSLIQSVLEKIKDTDIIREMDKGIRCTMLAYIIQALSMESKGHRFHNFSEVYDLRQFVSGRSNMTKEECDIVLTEGAKKRLIAALEYYNEYMNYLSEMQKTSGVKNLCSIYRRKGWFGALVCDHLFGRDDRLFHISPKLLAEASLRNVSSMYGYTSALTGCRAQRLPILIEAAGVIRGKITPKR